MTPLPDDRSADRFAARVRDVFGAYEEPVDEAALARLRADLASPLAPMPGPGPAPERAPDRAPARPVASRVRRAGIVAGVALVLAAGAWLWSRPAGAPSDPPAVASASRPEAGSAGPVRPPDRLPAGAPAPVERRAAPSHGGPDESLALVPNAPGGPPARLQPPLSPAPRTPVWLPLDPLNSEGPAGRPLGPPPVPPPGPPSAPDPAPVFVASAPETDPLAAVPAGPRAAEARRSGVRLVAATAAAVSDGRRTAGGGLAAGAAREWRVGRGVSLSAGALVAYTRADVEAPQAFETAFSDIEADPTQSVDVVARSRFAALALEVPLDIGVTLASVPRGRVGLSVGVVPAVYAVQTLREDGQTYTGRLVENPAPGGPLLVISAASYAGRDAARPPGRFGVGLNLALGYASDGPFGLDVTARLPLAGATARALPVTLLGVRLRYALP